MNCFSKAVRQSLAIFDEKLIFVPDQEPKKTAVIAAQETGATLVVWNTKAQQSLQAQHIRTQLVSPHILQGFELQFEEQGLPDFYHRGSVVVVKSSGSGMPKHWLQQIEQQCHLVGKQTEIFLPDRSISYDRYRARRQQKTKPHEVKERLAECYQALGIKTEWIICYPSEMVSIIAEMHTLGSNVGFLSLPPRGEHEIHNLEWAFANYLCAGMLRFNNQDSYQPNGPIIGIEELASILDSCRWNTIDLVQVIGTNQVIDVVRKH